VGNNVSIDSETFLMTNFVNLKIKSAQYFKGAHRNRLCVFIEVSAHIYLNRHHLNSDIYVIRTTEITLKMACTII
jgi:hypothetical protein